MTTIPIEVDGDAGVDRGQGSLMSKSNRVVTYIDMGLNSVAEYWDELIVPSVKKFQTKPSPRALFHAASAVWHLHDWVWHDQNRGQDSHSPAFKSYRADFLADCPALGWLRDIADAGKHRGLGRQQIDVKEANLQIVLNVALYVAAMIPSQDLKGFFLVLNDGSKQDADQVLRTAVEFWRDRLKDKNLPSP